MKREIKIEKEINNDFYKNKKLTLILNRIIDKNLFDFNVDITTIEVKHEEVRSFGIGGPFSASRGTITYTYKEVCNFTYREEHYLFEYDYEKNNNLDIYEALNYFGKEINKIIRNEERKHKESINLFINTFIEKVGGNYGN